MTRKEEIKQESKRRHLEKYNQEGFCPDFEKGAEWTDEHPSQELKRQMIDKATKWLALNAQLYGGFNPGSLEDMVTKFTQAMKEE